MRLNRSGYLIREGFRSIGTHGFMSFATVTIIMACLIIMGSVTLLSLNIDRLIKSLENQNEVVAFVDENYSEDSARALQGPIESIDNISSVEFVTRAEAFDNFMENYSSDLSEGLDTQVLRDRYVIHLTDIARMGETKSALESVEGVAKVKAHLDYAKTFITIRNVVSVVSLEDGRRVQRLHPPAFRRRGPCPRHPRRRAGLPGRVGHLRAADEEGRQQRGGQLSPRHPL